MQKSFFVIEKIKKYRKCPCPWLCVCVCVSTYNVHVLSRVLPADGGVGCGGWIGRESEAVSRASSSAAGWWWCVEREIER